MEEIINSNNRIYIYEIEIRKNKTECKKLKERKKYLESILCSSMYEEPKEGYRKEIDALTKMIERIKEGINAKKIELNNEKRLLTIKLNERS